jgi:hypothetical protein
VSATSWGVLVIFLASFTVLAVLLVGLVRQLKGLASTLEAFQERVQPLAERLARDGAVAQDRLQELSMGTQNLGARGTTASNGSTADPARSGDAGPWTSAR